MTCWEDMYEESNTLMARIAPIGAYNGDRIACFDDQVGGHGSVGGEQMFPFLILPKGHPVLSRRDLQGFTFLYHEVFMPYRLGMGTEAMQGQSSNVAERKSRNIRAPQNDPPLPLTP